MLEHFLKQTGLNFEREYRFHPVHKFRFDFAFPDLMIAIEIEGSTYQMGRHTRGKGYRKDCEKYNLAACMGWTVLRYTTDMLRDNVTGPLEDLKKIIKLKYYA